MDDSAHVIILIGPAKCGKTVAVKRSLKNGSCNFITDESCDGARGGYTEKGDLVAFFMYQLVDTALNATHVGYTSSYMLFGAGRPGIEELEQIAQRDPGANILGLPHHPTEAIFAQKVEEALGHTGENIKGYPL